MALRQFLWIDGRGATAHYAAPRNIAVGAGSSGTLALWQWPLWRHDNSDLNWRLEIDATNYIRQYQGRSFQVCSNGTVQQVSVDRNTSVFDWDFMVYTWNFTTPGAGQIKAYWNGTLVGTTLLTANAPNGTPTRMVLGPYTDTDTRGASHLSWLATWNRALVAEEITSLWREGHRHRLQPGEWNDNLQFYASFDGRYNADYAKGDAQFRVDGAIDRYCLIKDGALLQGRRVFPIGRPRHDFSEWDRIPLAAPCIPTLDFGRAAFVRDSNAVTNGQIEVLPGFTGDRRLGAAFISRPLLEGDGLTAPSTFRQRVYLPSSENLKGRISRLGPVDYLHYPLAGNDVFDQYGSGRRFSVVDDGANTTTRIKTDLDARFTANYWTGAMLVFLTGACSGRRLKVTAYDSTTKVLTLEGALPAIPAAGSLGVAEFTPKIMGCRSTGTSTQGQRLPEMNMDANLWETYGGSQQFTELEYQFSDVNNNDLTVPNFVRYDRGRVALVDGVHTGAYENGACYGKPSKWEDNTLQSKILLERIEIDGPTTYQILRRKASGAGPAYADNFMVVQAQGQSTKVWRTKDTERAKIKPVKCVAPTQVRADLKASGTWRHDIGSMPIPIEGEGTPNSVVCALVGIDSAGVSRMGYVVGTWDDNTSRIRWVDEVAPNGRSNPVIEISRLKITREPDGITAYATPVSILKNCDDTWTLQYVGLQCHPDHFLGYMLCGAPDRWSFDPDKHWWERNPIAPILGGPDRLSGDGSGSGQWVNRDADWHLVENPYAKDTSQRFFGYARGKSITHRYTGYQYDLRPVIGVRGSDVKSLIPLPHGNTLSPLVGALVHHSECAVLGQSDCIGLYSDTATGFTSGVYPFVSEDGIHFQRFANDTEWIPPGELSGEPSRLYPARPFKLGDRRIYYYYAGTYTNFASVRYQGEAWYQLKSTATSGMFETSLIQRPAEGWGPLAINVTPGGGSLLVDVIDGDTERPIAGFVGEAMSPVSEGISQNVTWNGLELDHCPAQYIRLRFRLSRPSTSVTTPKVYEWKLLDCSATAKPKVDNALVNGKTDPTNILVTTPEFSWEYLDEQNWEQTAYQVIVSSSREKLDGNEGDWWDSEIVESEDTQVVYAGAALEEGAVYHWKVRVRNAKGVWSEEW